MSQTLDRADADLIADCVNGDRDAWAVLITRYKRLVYSIPFRAGLSFDDCDEIFQAVWLDCYRHLASLRDPQRFEAWLIRIAVRQSYRHKRQQRLHLSLSEDSVLELSEEGFATRLLEEQAIRVAVDQLPERCHEVIKALFFEQPQPTYAELARRLGLSANSIGFTRERCLKCMGSILKELGYRY
jgi:RNA polymerase sigma factor (sigma-70 family)